MAQNVVLIELDRQEVKRPSLHAISLAKQLSGDFAVLVLGHGLDQVAASLVSYGATSVIVADHSALAEPLADRYASVIADVMRQRARKRCSALPRLSAKTFCRAPLPSSMRRC
jgi:electron transfer flavoprotein alpha subunit